MDNSCCENQKFDYPLLDLLDRLNIKAVVFDLDNTLVNTGDYYEKALMLVATEYLEKFKSNINPDLFRENFVNSVFEAFRRRGGTPELIMDEVLSTFESLSVNPTQEEISSFKSILDDFYALSPEKYYGAEPVLDVLISDGKKILIHSNAQEDWTNIKVKTFRHNIPYIAVPIKEKKDAIKWKVAFLRNEVEPENTLVVGDSISSDILPAIQAGCRNVVWIDNHSKGLPIDIVIPNGVNLYVVRSIKDLLFISSL